MRVRALLIPAAVALLLPVHPANAATTTQGIWSDGGTVTSCGASLGARRCSFTFDSFDCAEHAAMGTQILGCRASVRFTALVAPILQSGRVVGCQSRQYADDLDWGVGYDSINPAFDNDVDQIFAISVKDVFADGKPGVVTVDAAEVDEQGAPVWIAQATFHASCASAQSNVWSGYGTGSVTVHL